MGGLLSYMAVIYLGSWLVILILGFGINGIYMVYGTYIWHMMYGIDGMVYGI